MKDKEKVTSPTFKYSTPLPGSDLVHSGRQMVKQRPKPNSQWELERATKTVAYYANGVEDCRVLLDMLGLPDGQDESAMKNSEGARERRARYGLKGTRDEQ